MYSKSDYKYTCCPNNCWPVNCGIKIKASDGEIIELSGNEFHDINRGMLCVKGQSCGELQNNPNRLLHPLKRAGKRGENKWKRISWEEALEEIAEKIIRNKNAGHPEASAIYHSHGNIVQRINWKILTPRFANMAGITLWDGNFPCWYDVGVAQELTGYWGYHNPTDIGEHTSTLVNWAQDPCASMANMVPYITQLKERGGTVITIDPRVTQTAALSDFHLRPRLGSDVFLANAIANILIKEKCYDEYFIENYTHGFAEYKKHLEKYPPKIAARECAIEIDKIYKLADYFINSKPLCINLTRGALGKQWNGVQMVRAILCLIPLSRNIGIKGGGAVWGEAIEWNNNLQAVESRLAKINYPANNYNSILRALENKTVNTLLVVGGNPLSQWPDIKRLKRAMMNLDLIVVNDLFLNHTACEVADIILPATTWIEELGLRTSNRRIYLTEKIFNPAGEAKEASEWMNTLASKIGIEDYFPWQSKEECLDDCLKTEICKNATVQKLRAKPEGMEANLPEVPFADFKFSSPTGKFEFLITRAAELGIVPLPTHTEPIEGKKSTPKLFAAYPLNLISARRNSHFHSFYNSHQFLPTLNFIEPEPILFVHPADALQRRIADAEMVEIFNERGNSKVKVELTTEVNKGDVCLNDSWQELNILTSSATPVSDKVTISLKMGGQPSYQNTLVNIRKINQ